ncbi:hypothetical protein QE374_002803 [Microbacterium sp. SORGH_AS428]|uniref:hypothetical protein n=1 Tax=Microbacterium sp. SORGH_AS_0428 TaxID=3041788 RepID=UPI0028664DD2|nr:hypothetical protein [Microbacterium sp. SORGH_AS_0428]MDR6200894.1 hypothetical protein [Microbacterium sp. SORGH_AS_0428]
MTEFRGAAVAESIAEVRAWAVLHLHDQVDSDGQLYPSLLVWRTGFGHVGQHLPILISRWSGYQSMAELVAVNTSACSGKDGRDVITVTAEGGRAAVLGIPPAG